MCGLMRFITSAPAYIGMGFLMYHVMGDDYSLGNLIIAMAIVIYADVVGYIQGKLSE